jgi:hypothetical protein
MRARVTQPSIGSVLFGHDLRRAVGSKWTAANKWTDVVTHLVAQIYRPKPTTRPSMQERAFVLFYFSFGYELTGQPHELDNVY